MVFATAMVGEVRSDSPVVPWCIDHFCGIDIFGDAEGCCPCTAVFNSSSCCFNTTLCGCIKTYGTFGLWCDTRCPCVGDSDYGDREFQGNDAQGDKSSIPASSCQSFPVAPLGAEDIAPVLEEEVANAIAGRDSTGADTELAELKSMVVNTLSCYFSNDAAAFTNAATQHGEVMDGATREALEFAVVAEDLVGALVVDTKSDSDLLEIIWNTGTPHQPWWWGIASGNSELKVFQAGTVEELADRSLRKAFRSSSSTTWRPVYTAASLTPATADAPGTFAEFLFYVGQEGSGAYAIMPYVLRLRYDNQGQCWRRVNLWTPASSSARLVF